MDNTTFCGDCKRNTDVVYDHTTGDIICSECGLVLEAWVVDERSEWRTFTDSNDDHDPNRVGSPTNPLLASLGGGLHTEIAPARPRPGGGNADAPARSVLAHRTLDDGSRAVLKAFAAIAAMADRLGLVPAISNRANEIYTKVVLEDSKSCRGRSHDALLAACLYVACNQEQLPRTVKEICSVANGATKKEIGRAKAHIMKQLDDVNARSIRAGDFVKRFCSNLGIMNNRVMKAAQETVQNLEQIDVRRSPISITAAVIYIVSQISEDGGKIIKGKPLKDVSIATGVAEGTIKNAYKDLHPYLSKIIPTWFAKESALKYLNSP